MDGGKPLSRIIADGTGAERDHAGGLLALLHYSAPERARTVHADPHPGNFRILPTAGSASSTSARSHTCPSGVPKPLGRLTRLALDGDAARWSR